MSVNMVLKGVTNKQLVAFVLAEHEKGTGLPVHPFSVVNASMPHYNRSLGLTTGEGTVFCEGRNMLSAYGCANEWPTLLKHLRVCNVRVALLD